MRFEAQQPNGPQAGELSIYTPGVKARYRSYPGDEIVPHEKRGCKGKVPREYFSLPETAGSAIPAFPEIVVASGGNTGL